MENDAVEQKAYANPELRKVLLIIGSYLKELLKKSWLILIFMLMFCGLVFWWHSKKIASYEAKASFMAADSRSSGASGLMRMAGQFGFSSRSQSLDADLLLELLSAKRMVHAALLNEIDIKGQNGQLINHYLDLNGNDKKVGDDGEHEGYRFKTSNVEELDEAGHLILSDVYDDIKKDYLDAVASNEGIVYITVDSPYETVSREMAVGLMESLRSYYVATAIEKQEENLGLVNVRVDSIHAVLQNAQYGLAAWYEKQQNRLKAGTVSPKDYMRKVELERKAEVANVVYIEAIKNQEIAEMELETKRPIIQVIDNPQYPLEKKNPSLLVPLILAGFLAFLLASILIIVRKLIRDALKPVHQ